MDERTGCYCGPDEHDEEFCCHCGHFHDPGTPCPDDDEPCGDYRRCH